MKVIHLLNRFGRNGISAGLINLVRDGFYDGIDLHILALAKGDADQTTLNILRGLLGPERVTYLKPDSKPILPDDFVMLTSALGKKFKSDAPDLVICSNTMSLLLARSVALLSPLPIVSFMHATTCQGKYMRAALRLTSFKDSAVLGDASITLKEIVPQIFLVRLPAYVVPLVIPELGTARRASDVYSFNLGSLGRLHAEKNYAELVHAMDLLAKQGRNFHLTIAGEGPQRKELEQLIGQFGLQDSVSLPGYQDKQALLKTTHIYIQPSLAEGLCLSFIEAMGAGNIVVGTNVGGMREYGEDNYNMYKAKGFDRHALAEAIGQAMDEYALMAPLLSSNAIETASQHFGKEIVEQQWQLARQALTNIAERHARKPALQQKSAPRPDKSI
jgi:glycosyltransferase involved in cell wall biosynthesis